MAKTYKKKIFFIVGPTAVGKSKFALGLAEKINGEIVSCDSMQVYRGLDILSCKPSLKEQRKIPHHLISCIKPSQNFDVNQFVELSKRLIKEIHARGGVPIFTGGTGLYIDSLLNGIFEGPGQNPKIRNELYRKAKLYGNKYLYRRLKKIDPKAAGNIHINDLRRIVRALEVYKIIKKPISQLQKQRKGILKDKHFDVRIIGLTMPREKLYEIINKRVDLMFRKGAVAEVKKILKDKCSKTFRQALGIKEIDSYLKKDMSLGQAKQLLKRNTRRYAKRQITWFKKNTKIQWVGGSSSKKATDEIINNIV
ncbi:MAG: tRNA (adenosine(37)-N6)-dimethylallyltransferase MiaA [Candidatus Omnitrophica bacterium]|nr:tRNA (adenosine(37)-N6)-dimethylallyltransferase MiaA [Candidatus Omnitrophota bacterium]